MCNIYVKSKYLPKSEECKLVVNEIEECTKNATWEKNKAL